MMHTSVGDEGHANGEPATEIRASFSTQSAKTRRSASNSSVTDAERIAQWKASLVKLKAAHELGAQQIATHVQQMVPSTRCRADKISVRQGTDELSVLHLVGQASLWR